jgi:hypothetical protein
MSEYYNPFDLSIQCEELMEVSPEEQEEVFALIAQENEARLGFSHWLDDLEPTERAAYLDQAAFEQTEASRKDWLRGYSPNQEGNCYGAIAV